MLSRAMTAVCILGTLVVSGCGSSQLPNGYLDAEKDIGQTYNGGTDYCKFVVTIDDIGAVLPSDAALFPRNVCWGRCPANFQPCDFAEGSYRFGPAEISPRTYSCEFTALSCGICTAPRVTGSPGSAAEAATPVDGDEGEE